MTLDEMKNHYVVKVLNDCQGSRIKATRILGVAEKTLYNYLEKMKPDLSEDIYGNLLYKGGAPDVPKIPKKKEVIDINRVCNHLENAKDRFANLWGSRCFVFESQEERMKWRETCRGFFMDGVSFQYEGEKSE